uniref:RAP domain-containing protein n=1 Tax=Tetradesmus obliquus TaxID=3088 RepID=A0A383WKK8_TETOB|eukprot:jgi/Sobl393_1/8418/SZX77998.1
MRGANTLRLLLSAGAQRLAAAQAGATVSSSAAWLSGSASTSNSLAAAATQLQAMHRRGFTSSRTSAAAAAQAQVSGDVSAVVAEVDALLSRGGAGPKDIADAAMALAYLQARSDRRVWGKLFEAAAAAKADFDAASLTSFLWAANTAGVGHFKTLYELAGPAAKLLPSLSPAQLATVVEALGAAGVNDTELLKAVSGRVVSKAGEFSASQLAKVLGGFAAAGVPDVALTKAVLAALGGKAGGDASAKDVSQVLWALAKAGRADASVLPAMSKALGAKLSPGDAPQDLLAGLWGLAQLGAKADAGMLSKAAGVIKAAVGELSTEQQVYAAWSFALLGQADKDLYSSLFNAIGAAVTSAPDCVPVPLLGCLAEAQLLVADKLGAQAPKLPAQVLNYALSMHGVVGDAAKLKSGSAGAAFRAEVAEATARATGARYKPEIAAAVAALPKVTADGLPVEMAVEALKVAVLPLDEASLSSSTPRVPLGPVLARAELLRARGYTPAIVSAPEFNAQPDATAKAKFVLAAIKAAGVNVNAQEKKLNEPFDPYAD